MNASPDTIPSSLSFSFIVPAYNVEAYLRDCLLSILAIDESYKYEIILVDDGCTDNSVASVQDLLNDHSRLHLITQQNSGMSVARNVALDVSRGQYIVFIDSDDMLDSIGFVSCVESMDPTADIVIGGFKNLVDGNLQLQPPLMQENLCADGRYFLTNYFLNGLHSVVWRNIYRREFLEKNALRFMEGVRFEDAEFSPRCLYLANKVCYINTPIYHYRKRSGSTLNSRFTEDKFHDMIEVTQRIFEFSKKVDHRPSKGVIIDSAIGLLSMALYLHHVSDLPSQAGRALKLFRKLDTSNWKYRLLQIILPLSRRVFYGLLKKAVERRG